MSARSVKPSAIVRLLPGDVHAIVRTVERRYNVGASYWHVLRDLARGVQGFRQMRPAVRRRILRVARAAHARNRWNYQCVQLGRFSSMK